MTTATVQQKQQQPLSLDDKVTIARVLTWDYCKEIHPEQIVTIWMEGEIAWIRLDEGCVPIHRDTFKEILAAQREIEERGDDREPIETRTHQDNEKLVLAPLENVPHAYKVNFEDKFLGHVYRSLLLGGWSISASLNTQDKASFADPFDAAERLFLDWQVEQELGFSLPY